MLRVTGSVLLAEFHFYYDVSIAGLNVQLLLISICFPSF